MCKPELIFRPGACWQPGDAAERSLRDMPKPPTLFSVPAATDKTARQTAGLLLPNAFAFPCSIRLLRLIIR
jgi:hypothetical protein